MLLVHVASLAASSAEWARSGELSRRMHRGVQRLAAETPQNSVIVLGEGPRVRTIFWEWAVPWSRRFRKPPSGTRLSRRCAGSVAGTGGTATAARWSTLGEDSLPLYVFYWDAQRGEAARVLVTREKLRAAYEHAARRPFVPRFDHPDEAARLVEVLGRP